MKYNTNRIINYTVTVLTFISLSACVKKTDQNQSASPVAAEIQKTTAVPLLEPLPMKLCVRPAHRLGLKKCVRSGRWVRLTVAANDVDNDRSDVFSHPRLTLKKENFYIDTFRFQDGINHIANYPDYFHALAPYGGFSHFIFAMPNQPNLSVTYGYAGRDEARENLHRPLSGMVPDIKEFVKIQHWNDGRAFKKHAAIYFETFADYSEVNHRYDCGWMEQEQGYDYTQMKTKEGVDVPRIPETQVWRKIAETCDQLPASSADGKYRYLPFRDLSSNAISTDHKFTSQNRLKVRVYNTKSTNPDETPTRINFLNPMSFVGMKTDGTTTIFTNERKEEIARWESIYDEDLKDESFQPERKKGL